MTNNHIVYTDVCLTFMDIQGFKEMVLARYPDRPFVIHEILKEFKRAQYHDPSNFLLSWQPEIVSFSDSIVRGISKKDRSSPNNERIINEIKALRLVQQRLLTWEPPPAIKNNGDDAGVFIRGGMAQGPAFLDHGNNMIFGPAMIKAFELADVKGSPFRIVVDQAAVDAYPKAIELLVRDNMVAQDCDGLWFVNYLSVNPFRSYGLWTELERLENVRDVLQKQVLTHCRNDVLLKKYLWASEKHNSAVRESKPLNDALAGVGLERDRLAIKTGP
ncbi:MAG: hypothetical protein FWG23_05935 [Eggerthellaceae bacterium]|jgi:hypothetical protein|nr:hypothetical protein [Eggerthellaceae bacterium]MDR2716051.1 hypothetical protein [Coriobacteriaceae bacterium]